MNKGNISHNYIDETFPASKLSGGSDSVSVYSRNSSPIQNKFMGKIISGSYLVAEQSFIYTMKEPLVLMPGYRVNISNAVKNATLVITTEHFEEPLK